jgi:hypothetical protein
MDTPHRLVEHLRKENYHPRSNKHGDVVCEGILADLIVSCPEIAQRAATGHIVAMLKYRQIVGHDEWVIDLALGEPAGPPRPPPAGQQINFDRPSLIQIAVEAKTVMTEHKKARKNRLRDLSAFHSHAHNYSRNTIAAGNVVINASRYFWSPLRDSSDVTDHGDVAKLTGQIIDTYRNIRVIDDSRDGAGMEAMSIIVVEHDNLKANPSLPEAGPHHAPTRLVEPPLAPDIGDPLHYSTMIRRICAAFRKRF